MRNQEIVKIYLTGFRDAIDTILYAFDNLEIEDDSNEKKDEDNSPDVVTVKLDCNDDNKKEVISQIEKILFNAFKNKKEDK